MDFLRVFKYAGNKQNHLVEIIPIITDLLPNKGVVLDLFAGTQSVGYALKRDYTVYSNDVQRYSHIAGKALIENNRVRVSKKQAEEELMENFHHNYKELEKYFVDALRFEGRYQRGELKAVNRYRHFENRFPHTGWNSFSNDGAFPEVSSLVRKVKYEYMGNGVDSKAYHYLFSTYFANCYWGIKQAMEIDSIRYAIDMLPEKKVEDSYKKAIYLTALLYAASITVSGSFHTAEHPEINENNFQKILGDRRLSILEKFFNKVDDIHQNIVFSKNKNICWNMDSRSLFDSEQNPDIWEILQDVDLVYLDPPYNSAHYSRFYHCFETLVKYDYPKNEYKGRYRQDRFQSNFCRKSRVNAEFNDLLGMISEFCPNVAISYSSSFNSRSEILTLWEIKSICNRYFDNINSKFWRTDHSSHNQNGSRFKKKREHLIICGN